MNNGQAAQVALGVQDFQQYLQQERQLRTDAEQARAQARQEADNRQKAEAQVKRVPPCDGATPQGVREWIAEVDLTRHYSDSTVYIASQTAKSALRRELEHFLSSQRDRRLVTWDQLKAHLQGAFLSPHEDDRLRHELEKVKQGAYETSASYGRRYREAADLAYPDPVGAARNENQVRLLLKHYLRGLRDRHTVERLVREGRPADFSQAMTLVQGYEADDYRLSLALDEHVDGRREEAMEVGAYSRAPPARAQGPVTKEADENYSRDLAEMKRQVSGLTQQFTKLVATLKNQPQDASKTVGRQPHGRGQPRKEGRPAAAGQEDLNQFSSEGLPICNYCKKSGHIARNCLKRQRQRAGRHGEPNQGGQ